MTVLRGLLDLVFPAGCLLCPGVPLAREPFCAACAEAVLADPLAACPACAATVGPFAVHDGKCGACRAEGFGFDAVRRMGVYSGQRRELVLRLKAASQQWLAERLVAAWLDRRGDELRGLGCTAVVPVPMHWRRRLWRGSNHAATLSAALARGLGLPHRWGWLWRLRHTPEQKGLGRTARRENLRGAFGVAEGAALAGERVLLADDVMTTGTTASEAARTLKKAGASFVGAAVLARVAEEAGGAASDDPR